MFFCNYSFEPLNWLKDTRPWSGQYKLVTAMHEPLIIPRVFIERFLEKSIRDAAEILSWMRIENEGDGLSPKLRQSPQTLIT